MTGSNNTKTILAQALKELMNQRSFSKISVSDICTQCKVSRKSFYYHFQDKYDLMNWIFYTEFVGTLQLPGEADNWDLLLNVCTYFFEEQAFYKNALSITGQNSFKDYFSEVLQPFLFVFIQDVFSDMVNIEFFVQFYTDAFLSSIIRWLNDGAQIPPEEFAALLRRAITSSRQA